MRQRRPTHHEMEVRDISERGVLRLDTAGTLS